MFMSIVFSIGIVFEYQKQRKIKQKILDLFDIERE